VYQRVPPHYFSLSEAKVTAGLHFLPEQAT
jgi:hypothetical protein